MKFGELMAKYIASVTCLSVNFVFKVHRIYAMDPEKRVITRFSLKTFRSAEFAVLNYVRQAMNATVYEILTRFAHCQHFIIVISHEFNDEKAVPCSVAALFYANIHRVHSFTSFLNFHLARACATIYLFALLMFSNSIFITLFVCFFAAHYISYNVTSIWLTALDIMHMK